MTRPNRLSLGWLSIVKASRSARQHVHRVAAQGLQQAQLTGAKLAKRIVAIQKAANLHPRMMRKSVRSVANRSMTRDSDRQWQAAYVATAEQLVPGIRPPVPAALAPPTWPYKGGLTKTDPEVGQ